MKNLQNKLRKIKMKTMKLTKMINCWIPMNRSSSSFNSSNLNSNTECKSSKSRSEKLTSKVVTSLSESSN